MVTVRDRLSDRSAPFLMTDEAAPTGKPRKPIPSGFQRRTLWSAITALSIVVIGAVAVGAVWMTGFVLSYLQPVLVPVAVAGILAYLLEPVIGWLNRKGLSSGQAMTAVYAAFLILVIVLVVAVLVPTFGQAQEFYREREAYQERATEIVTGGVAFARTHFNTGIAEEYYTRGVEWISQEGPEIAQQFGEWIWTRLRGAFGFFGYLLGMLLVPIYLFFFLREGHRISQTWTDYVPLRASRFKDEVVGTLTEINEYLISFFRGQMVVSLIDGALVAIALSVIELPYALLIGVFLAILGLIPYIGNLLVMVPAVLIAVGHFGATATVTLPDEAEAAVGNVVMVELPSGREEERTISEINPDGTAEVLVNAWTWLPHVWAYPLIVLAIFLILQQINGLVTAPKIVGDSVGLHPLTVIFSVLFWSLLLGGLLGALLAVPLTASVKVLFRRYIWERRIEPAVGKTLGKGDDPDGDGEGGAAGEAPSPEPA